jgi:hypothetical protein
VPQYPYQAADVSAGVVGAPYSLPFSPATVTFGLSPTLVLGESGIAFATDGVNTNNGPSVVSFNVSSGSANLLYQAASGDTLSIIEATADGGVTIGDANAGGVVQVAGTGNSPNAPRIHRSQPPRLLRPCWARYRMTLALGSRSQLEQSLRFGAPPERMVFPRHLLIPLFQFQAAILMASIRLHSVR